MPSRWATAAASTRLFTPSLRRMFETCTLAVLSDTYSSSPIWRLVRPAGDQGQHLRFARRQAEALGGALVERDPGRGFDADPRPAWTRRRSRPAAGAAPSSDAIAVGLSERRSPPDPLRRPRLPPRLRGASAVAVAHRSPSSVQRAAASAHASGSETVRRVRLAAAWARCAAVSRCGPSGHRSANDRAASIRCSQAVRSSSVDVDGLATRRWSKRAFNVGDDAEHRESCRPQHRRRPPSTAQPRSAASAASSQLPSARWTSAAVASRTDWCHPSTG